MIRAFAAIPLPEDLRQRLHMLALTLPLPRRVPPENLHLTLAFLGEVPEPVLEEAHFAFETIDAPRIALTLRGLGLFGGAKPRAVYADLAPDLALDRLQARVVGAARRAGIAVEARRFVPHVTLGRMQPHEVDLPRLERALLEAAGFVAGPFTADSFALFRSHLGHRGASYEELARYPLR